MKRLVPYSAAFRFAISNDWRLFKTISKSKRESSYELRSIFFCVGHL